MSVAERIKADMEAARRRFSSLTSLSGDREMISFTINGQEFNAALPEVYGCSCDVYGPDDLELLCHGSIVDIVATVLAHLNGERSAHEPQQLSSMAVPSLMRSSSAQSSQARSASTAFDLDPGEMCVDQEGPAEAEDFGNLRAEICELEAMGVQCSINGCLFGSASVTLSVPLPETITRSTADAWGLARDQPVRFSFEVSDSHYRRVPSQRLEATAWQEKTTAGYVKLDAGVQLQNMVGSFWAHLCGVTVLGSSCDGGLQNPPAHLVQKKKDILDAAAAQPGVLLPLAAYIRRRLPCLHEYCVICDEPLVFPPLLRPTVCTRTLCSYSARAFGTAVTGEFSGQNASLELWDLLVAMAVCAGRMEESRMRILFGDGHFPMLFLPRSSQPAFEANDDGFKMLRKLLGELSTYRSQQVDKHGIFWLNQAFREEERPLLASLLGWIWDSNRSYLLSLRKEDRIDALQTPYQYLLLSAPPETEEAFQKLKAQHGTEFCFHGSNNANWHCILRQGLKNASGTKLMTAGQAHGPGIYLARDSATSAGYSGIHHHSRKTHPPAPPTLDRQVTGQRVHDPDSLVMLAVCEVALVPTLRKTNNIWVCPDEAAVVTRFFLVFRGQSVPQVQLDGAELTRELRVLTTKWTHP